MAVNDSPTTRIKAADAGALLKSVDLRTDLYDLLRGRGFLAGFAIKTFGDSDTPPLVEAMGWIDCDYELIREYAMRLGERTPDSYKARTGLVIVAIHHDGVAETATWGKKADDCKALGAYGSEILKGLPVAPFQTWWGWGNKGVPKRMSASRLAALSDNQRAYVDRNTHPAAVP